MKHCPHAGEKGVKQRKPRKRGLRKHWTWYMEEMIKPTAVTMVKRGNKNKVGFKVMRNLGNMKVETI